MAVERLTGGWEVKENQGMERRGAMRYMVDDSLFATFRPNFDKVGRLKDISTSGAAIEYAIFGQTVYDQARDVEVDFFSRTEDFHLPKVPCRIVYDMKNEEHPSFNVFETRRCGLVFAPLSSQQATLIEVLIGKFGLGPTPD